MFSYPPIFSFVETNKAKLALSKGIVNMNGVVIVIAYAISLTNKLMKRIDQRSEHQT